MGLGARRGMSSNRLPSSCWAGVRGWIPPGTWARPTDARGREPPVAAHDDPVRGDHQRLEDATFDGVGRDRSGELLDASSVKMPARLERVRLQPRRRPEPGLRPNTWLGTGI